MEGEKGRCLPWSKEEEGGIYILNETSACGYTPDIYNNIFRWQFFTERDKEQSYRKVKGKGVILFKIAHI